MTDKEWLRYYARNELARRDFWLFCQRLAPDFYKDDRKHLKELCTVLQALYEGRIAKDKKQDHWKIFGEANHGAKIICKKLMINMPPQHGKTRTLILFNAWMLGINRDEKIITASFNDSTATDFSKYSRDLISEKKNEEEHIVYHDIFPETKIRFGTATFKKWALEGKHFNYLGTGVKGTVTSKGATVQICDDLVKDAEVALNREALEKIWLWYVGTFKSRVSANKGEPIEIINMTRWSLYDPCGIILASKAADDWYQIKYEAYDEKTDTMLCDELLGKKRYLELKELAQEDKVLMQIFMANYHQEPFEAKGLLFDRNKLHRFKPRDFKFETRLGYIDVADEGDDSLAMPLGGNEAEKIYITDIVFTKDDTDTTMPMCADLLNKLAVRYCRVESNNQGSIFRKQMQKLLPRTNLLPVNSTANKHTRIILMAWFICKYCYFLEDEYQSPQYRAFMKELCAYTKEGEAKHDDAPDALSGLAVFFESMMGKYYKLKPLQSSQVQSQESE